MVPACVLKCDLEKGEKREEGEVRRGRWGPRGVRPFRRQGCRGFLQVRMQGKGKVRDSGGGSQATPGACKHRLAEDHLLATPALKGLGLEHTACPQRSGGGGLLPPGQMQVKSVQGVLQMEG